MQNDKPRRNFLVELKQLEQKVKDRLFSNMQMVTNIFSSADNIR